MKRKNPTLLPGKELWAIHFDPLTAGRTTPAARIKEIRPLLSLAERKAWVSAEIASELSKELSTGETKKLWEVAWSWENRIDGKDEQQSHAYAGWLFLWNLKKYSRLLEGLRPPYKALHGTTMEISKKLEQALIVEELEKSNTYRQTIGRHFLGMVICEKVLSSKGKWGPESQSTSPDSWISLKRELLGKDYYQETKRLNNQRNWVLTPSHGYANPEKPDTWVTPSINSTLIVATELINSFPHYTKDSTQKRLLKLSERVKSL
jgi:hypothetical protein